METKNKGRRAFWKTKKTHSVPDVNDTNVSITFFMWLREWVSKENVVALFSGVCGKNIGTHLGNKIELFKHDPLIFYNSLDEQNRMRLVDHYHRCVAKETSGPLRHVRARFHFVPFTTSKVKVKVRKDLIYSKCSAVAKGDDSTSHETDASECCPKEAAKWAARVRCKGGHITKDENVRYAGVLTKNAWISYKYPNGVQETKDVTDSCQQNQTQLDEKHHIPSDTELHTQPDSCVQTQEPECQTQTNTSPPPQQIQWPPEKLNFYEVCEAVREYEANTGIVAHVDMDEKEAGYTGCITAIPLSLLEDNVLAAIFH